MLQQTRWPHSHVTWRLCCAHKWLLWPLKTPSNLNVALSNHKMCSKKPRSRSCSHKTTRSFGDDDDNNEAWDLESMSSGMDTGLYPGGLNGQCDVRYPTLRQFLMYYDMDSVPPYPEPSLRVLVSGECMVNPYPIVVLVGRCQSPSSSRPAGKTHYCLDGGMLDTFLHNTRLQRRPSYHKHQGLNTYHTVRATWSSFYLPFLADVLLPQDDFTVQQ
jgi:hypothetical protein